MARMVADLAFSRSISRLEAAATQQASASRRIRSASSSRCFGLSSLLSVAPSKHWPGSSTTAPTITGPARGP